MAMLFNFRSLGQHLREVRPGVHQGLRLNPPRRPREYEALLDRISKWAKSTNDRIVSGNAKLDKGVAYDPTSTNSKLMKTEKKVPWLVKGVALMPAHTLRKFFHGPDGSWDKANLTKFNITQEDVEAFDTACPGKTPGCMAVCLTDSGRMAQTSSTVAQVRRHLTFHKDRQAFMVVLAVGIARLQAKGRRKGAAVGVRLNVTSDLSWENISIQVDPWLAKYLTDMGNPTRPGKYRNIMQVFPRVLFYDYTKVWSRMDKFLKGRNWPSNYHLVWSLAETPINRRMAIRVLRSKKSTVSVAFDTPRTKKLPETLTIVDDTDRRMQHVQRGVFNADDHDMRALDQPGHFAGLHFKTPTTGLSGVPSRHVRAEWLQRAGKFVIRTNQGKDRHPVIYARGGEW